MRLTHINLLMSCTTVLALTLGLHPVFAKTAVPMNVVQCGAAKGGMFPSPPMSGLCAPGSVVTVPIAQLGTTQYQWTCGSPPPVPGVLTLPSPPPEVCIANKKYNGQCGAANGVATSSAPSANLCTLGTASTPVQTGANYAWTCTGVMPATGATIATCSAPTSTVQAVSETVSAAPGSAGSMNVRANDTAPGGTVYSLAAGSTCNPISITALGVVSYTAPPAGQSCTLNYTLCNSGQCATATLTVNSAVPPPSVLNVSKTASGSARVVGLTNQFYTLAVTVANGPTSNPIHINDTLPAGIVTSGTIGSSGGTLTGCPASGAMSLAGCSLAAGLANGTYNVTIPVGVGSAATTGTNIASISSHNSNCATPNPACSATTGKVLVTPASGGLSTGTTLGAAIIGSATLVKVYTIGVTVSGLPAGKSVVLQNNGSDNLTVSVNGATAFSNAVQGAYAVTVLTQPVGAMCTVSGAVGVATASVLNIPVACAPSRFALVPKAVGGFYDVTECVKDTVTGLIWEGKTASGVRSGWASHSNYDDVNQAQAWTGYANVNPTLSQVNATNNSIGYKNMVNSSSLCGSSAWRLPSKEELSLLYVAVGPVSQTWQTWLPNVGAGIMWSNSPVSSQPDKAFSIYFGYAGGPVVPNYRHVSGWAYIRLVR